MVDQQAPQIIQGPQIIHGTAWVKPWWTSKLLRSSKHTESHSPRGVTKCITRRCRGVASTSGSPASWLKAMQPWGCRKHPDVEGHACGVCLRMVQPEVATFPSDNEGLGCSEACWDSRRQHTHEHKHSLHARTHTHETHKRRHEDRRSGTGM